MTRSELPFKAPSGRTISIWGAALVLAGASAAVWAALQGVGANQENRSLPWWLLAAAFALGQIATIRIEVRDNAHMSNLADVVLLPAIVYMGASDTMLAASIGVLLVQLWRRPNPTKAAFNVALRAISVAVAIAAYHAVGPAGVTSLRGWLAGLAAVTTCEAVSWAGVIAVIALTASVSHSTLRARMLTLPFNVAIDLMLGLAAVYLWSSVGGGIIFVVVAAGVALEYANHGRLRRRHETLEQLYHFEQVLGGILESDEIITAVLGEALELFNAELAELVIRNENGTFRHALRLGDEYPTTVEGEHPFVALLGNERNVVLAARDTTEPAVVAALREAGVNDAIGLLLPSDVSGGGEVLVVADRLGGDQTTFTADDVELAEALATPTAMALRSGDLLEKLRAELEQKAYQASHDVLTGLANRRLFESEVSAALAARPESDLVGVLVIDLDGFKSLNDTFGHEAGDVFLQKLAANFKQVVGDRGLVARFGGDEFAVVIPRANDTTEVASIAHELNLVARSPIQITNEAYDQRGASIGVAVAPIHGENRFTLMRDADLAMYRAKQRGGGVAYHDDHEDRNIDRPTLIAALREAIHTSALSLQYQPKVYFDQPGVAGVEALVRWTHPRFGPIPPDEFIEAAESSGLIRPLTRWVLGTALAQCSLWHASGFALNVAVNVSPLQINDPEIVGHVKQLLETHNLEPRFLTLEITESSVPVEHSSDGRHVLGALQRLGVRLSIDDFGVGASGLARVKQLPVTEVKIDKSFITHITRSPTDKKMVASTINLLHDLDLVVVAEGVETQDTYNQLRNLHCDIAQGYLVSRPKTPEDLEPWLVEQFSGVGEPASAN